jgi:hypothetical protein
MVDNINIVLDKCLDRINAGEDLDVILSEYPEYAAQLKPLLQSALQTNRLGHFTVNDTAKRTARQRFDAALVARREQQRIRQPWFSRYLLRPAALATIATVIIVALVVFVSVQTAFSPGTEYQVSDITPVASSDGNFAFLISDEVNAISQFDNVSVTIARIGIQQSDEKWIEIVPTDKTVDLTTVPGDAVKVIWQGDIPVDNYQQVFIYVDNVIGFLKGASEATEIKLPGQKLHMAIPFTTSETSVTSFTYDLTVFATGSSNNSKYILKPQVGESGVAKESVPPATTKIKPEMTSSVSSNVENGSEENNTEEDKTKEEKINGNKTKEANIKEENTKETKTKEEKVKESKTKSTEDKEKDKGNSKADKEN